MAVDPTSYSKRVKILRKLLPVLALIGLLALIAGANRDMLGRFSQTAQLAVSSDLAIEAPQFEGRLKNGQSYILTAESGRQTDDNGVQLKVLNLRLSGANGAMQVTAKRGVFSGQRKAARFVGAVRLSDSQGNRLTTEKLDFNSEAGTLVAPQKIDMRGPAGALSADAMIADSKGGIYRFDKVKMRLTRGTP